MNQRLTYRSLLDIGPLVFISLLFSLILLGFFIRTLYVAHFFPIYPDEIAERIMLSRFLFDFPMKFDLILMCKKASYPYPYVWYFPGLVEWLIHGHTENLKTFRMLGVGTSVLISFCATYVICQKSMILFADHYKKNIFFILTLSLVISLLYIGVVPFFLVTIRPEQTILLLLSLLLIIFTMSPDTTRGKNILILLYFILISLLLYQHPKTFFFLPVCLVIAYHLCAHCKPYMIASLFTLLIFIFIMNYLAWTHNYECSNSPIVERFLATFNINFKNLIHDTPAFLAQIKDSFSEYQTEIDRISFQSTVQVNYLPPIVINTKLIFINKLIHLNYIIIFSVTLIGSLILYTFDVSRRKFLTPNLLTILFFLCSFSNLIINLCKNWYDAGYLWCLFVLTTGLFISQYIPNLYRRKITYAVISYFLCVGIASEYLLTKQYSLSLEKGYAGPGVSVATYHHHTIQKELLKATLLCHIDRNNSTNLILDDATYLYFQRSRNPLTFTYLQFMPDPVFLYHVLDQFDINGIIIRSTYIPQSLQKKYVHHIGHFVCVEKKNIKPVFNEMFNIHSRRGILSQSPGFESEP